VTSSPYTMSCPTANYANGSHAISAVASDAAGNKATATVAVNFSNTASGGSGGQASASDLWIYQNGLASGWSNGSWGLFSSTSFNSNQYLYPGCTKSIKVVQSNGGALRFLSGSWNALIPVDPSPYTSVSFAVYSTNSLNLNVYLMNASGVISTVKYCAIPNGIWTMVAIPVSSLDPSNQTFTMLVIQDVSGKSVTYYIDNVKLTGLPAPVLASPANGATNVACPVLLSWSPTSGSTSYRVQVATDQHFSSVVKDTTVSTSSVTLAGLQPGTTYYWWVCAHNGQETTQWSSTWSFTTLAVPAPPQLASPANGSTGQPLSDTLTWNASQNAARFQIEVSTSSSFSSNIINDSTMTSTSRIAASLSNGTTYYWRVQAINSVGLSGWSSTWSFTTLTTSDPPGLTVYADALSNPWVDASWGATLNYSNTSPVHSGSYSISVANGPWGGASFHYGSWNSGQYLNPSNYGGVQFALYSNSQTKFNIGLESDAGTSFPQVNVGSFSAGKWNIVTVSMSSLNPSNQQFDRVDIMEESGTSLTYYLDDIQLVGKTQAQVATGVNGNVNAPASLALAQNYPNPFNPTTVISYQLPAM